MKTDRLDVHADRPVLELERVTKAYRMDRPILRGVTFSIDRGEFAFVTGPSGAGKSTLLRLLYRAEEPDEGHVYFCGREIGRLGPALVPFFRRNLGIVFQDFRNLVDRTVYENVAIALEVAGLPARTIRSRVEATLESVGLRGRGGETVSTLSGGEQQRVAIARALVPEPTLILADEPTGNLDPELALQMVDLFEGLHARGTTVVFATHDRSLLGARPHRVLILEDGRVRESLDAAADAAAPMRTPNDAELRLAGQARLPH
jgi:cell division transport system ATP-binding protein